jgi:tetratricopeptide (TPR) repeat protein
MTGAASQSYSPTDSSNSVERQGIYFKKETMNLFESFLSVKNAKKERRHVFTMSHSIFFARIRSSARGAFAVGLCVFTLSAIGSPGENAPAARAFINEGVQLFRARRYAEALDSFGKARQQDPRDADAELLSGLASWELRGLPEAIDHFQRSIELRPSDSSARIHLCRAYWELGRFGEAATACRKAAEMAPTSSSAFNVAGSALFELGRFEEAQEMFLRAINISPTTAVFYYNLSGTQAAMGQLPEAVESVRTAIRLRPDFADARLKLGFYFIALRSHRESIETLEHVIDDNPEDERPYVGIAIAEKALGHFDKAMRAAKKATTLRPSFALAHYVLGILHFETGDMRSALRVEETLRLLDSALAEDYGRFLRSRYVVAADDVNTIGGSR